MEGADLDEAFRPWAEALSADQRRALVRWQAENDGYARIQRALRRPGLPFDPWLDRIVDGLVAATWSGRTPQDLTVYRGVRSSVDGFGRAGADLPELVGTTAAQRGFLSVTTSESIARERFLAPAGEGGPVLEVLGVPAGTPAAWLPLGGATLHADECELLLPPGRRILTTAVTFEGDLPILRGEVS